VGVGFDVEAVDLHPAATARACAARLAPEGLACALDIGWRSSTLSVWIDGGLVFVRALPGACVRDIGGALHLDRAEAPAVIERLACATDESPWGPPALTRGFRSQVRGLCATLAGELERSYTYLARRFPETESAVTFVCGGGAGLPGLIEGLGASIGTRILRATPSELIECGGGAARLGNDPGLVTACGLMLWREEGS
jgi:Tfp pilus assembly PilM family ATPase